MKKQAFTLAEVLVTLGVIGVVAAITIPGLIGRWQDSRNSETLKVSYSILSQGFMKMMADEEVHSLVDTTMWAHLLAMNFDDIDYEVEFFNKYFQTALSIPYEKQVAEGWPSGGNTYTGETCRKWVGKGSCWYKQNRKDCIGLRQNVFRLNNGALVRMGFFGTYPSVDVPGITLKRIVGQITIDTNGLSAPNVFGQDAFEFLIGENGRLYPIFGMDYAKYVEAYTGNSYKGYYWYGVDDGADRCVTGNGRACAASVMEKGWKINYYDNKVSH